MPGAAQIKAGEALWELRAKDQTAPDLSKVLSRMAQFAASVARVSSLAIGTVVAGAALAAGAIASSIRAFIGVSEQMRQFTATANPQAEALKDAWGEFRAVLTATQAVIGSMLAPSLTELLKIGTAVAHDLANEFVLAAAFIGKAWHAMIVGLEAMMRTFFVGLAGATKALTQALALPLKAI